MIEADKLLKKTPGELIQTIYTLDSENDLLKDENKRLQEKLNLLLSRSNGKKSEDSKQLEQQFDEPEVSDEQEKIIKEAEQEITVPEHKRKKPGRKPLPKELTRVDIIHDLAEEDKICHCGCMKKFIDEEVTEQLEYIPAKMHVNRHIRKKYCCPSCDSKPITLAAMPPQPIPKGIAGPGLLAQILVAKYYHHLPLYRQEEIFKDAGIDMPRAMTSSWVIKCSNLLQPLVNLMRDNILEYDIAYADETRVQVLRETGRDADKQSFMWSFAGGEPDKFSIIFKYSQTRNHDVPLKFFNDNYKGYIHCDGYSAYETMAKKNYDVNLVGCMLHARRKFMDIAKANKKDKTGLAYQAMNFFNQLTKVEHAIKNKNYNEKSIKSYRNKHAKPILDDFKIWLDTNIKLAPANFPIAHAIQYAINQWPKLIKYLDDGRLEWSNNLSERHMKSFATGRKNWLFSNSMKGAQASAIIYSLVLSCKHHKINMNKYFTYVLKTIPACQTLKELEELLPYNISSKLD